MKYRYRAALLAMAIVPLAAHSESYTCVSFEYPPLIQKGADGKSEGLAVDIVTSVFKQMGHTVKVELYPWGRSLSMAKYGETDCIFTLYRSAEREESLDFSHESLIPQIIYFYAKKGSPHTFSGDIDALKGLRIGTAHKINYGPRFEEARPKLTIDEAPTIEQNFKKLAIGRIDLIPSNLYTASSTLEQPGLKEYAGQIVKLPTPVESVASHIAFPKMRKLTALRDRFDAELKKFVASGEYKRLLEKYRIERTPELARFLQSK